MKEKKIEHIIEIDEFTRVSLLIPYRLDALELRGLMIKSKKLAGICEVKVRAYKKSGNTDGRNHTFSQKQADEIFEKMSNATQFGQKKRVIEELAKKYGKKEQSILDKWHNIKKTR